VETAMLTMVRLDATEAFMADHKPGEDSFLREATESGDVQMGWSDDEGIVSANDRRASAIFIPKSRNMDKVEFSSPKHTIQVRRYRILSQLGLYSSRSNDHAPPYLQKSIPVEFETPLKSKVRGSVSNSVRTPASFSASVGLSFIAVVDAQYVGDLVLKCSEYGDVLRVRYSRGPSRRAHTEHVQGSAGELVGSLARNMSIRVVNELYAVHVLATPATTDGRL
jgi:hypothetical protein